MANETIYFLYSLLDYSFQGSGTLFVDDESITYTFVPTPEYNAFTEQLFWNPETEQWYVEPLNVEIPADPIE